mmetsp:Transcript_12930/g.11450  ORF Transcript_12930/g.11450 Transcript_12930/m.11450 type:complete len:82 (+) Transcript_12930:219-464(+)
MYKNLNTNIHYSNTRIIFTHCYLKRSKKILKKSGSLQWNILLELLKNTGWTISNKCFTGIMENLVCRETKCFHAIFKETKK